MRNFVDSSSPVEVDGDEGGRDGEVVHKGVELQHEPELVTSRYELKLNRNKYFTAIFTVETHSDEEVDHEEDVECEVNLLGSVLLPWDALLNAQTVYEILIYKKRKPLVNSLPGVDEVDDE